MSTHHSLTIDDRGEGHVHRWQPRCTCGWVCVPIRDKERGAAEYRRHVSREERHAGAGTVTRVKRSNKQGAGRRTRTRRAGPKPLTPWEDLPPELQ